MTRSALITGVTGQDGSYLAEFLLNKGYVIHGLCRSASSNNVPRLRGLALNLQELQDRFILHRGDITDQALLVRLLRELQPDEIYNLAAQSHVMTSFSQPLHTAEVNAVGALNLLEAIRLNDLAGSAKFYQASTSELFGEVAEVPQRETTPFRPRSPYAISKLFAYWMTVNYREAYGFFACNGILFNHESPRRGMDFVTRKITLGLARIKVGIQATLYLGNLDAKRDWGHARDYVEMQWLMLQATKPQDYVIATGQQHSVRDFVEQVAESLDIKLRWEGSGISERAYWSNASASNRRSGLSHLERRKIPVIAVDKQFFRPAEVNTLLGDAQLAATQLDWKPKIAFEKMVEDMARADLLIAEQEVAGVDALRF